MNGSSGPCRRADRRYSSCSRRRRCAIQQHTHPPPPSHHPLLSHTHAFRTHAQQALLKFLQPPWSSYSGKRAARHEEEGRGKQIAKGIIFSARPIADSLFARHLASQLKDVLTLSAVHVPGGLHASGGAAELARANGLTALPSVAVWPDAEATAAAAAGQPPQPQQPLIFSIAERTDVQSRERLLTDLRRASLPSVPQLTASNYNELCGPSTGDGGGGIEESYDRVGTRWCALLFVQRASSTADGGAWPREAVNALKAMREAGGGGGGGGGGSVRFAWVDATRQEPLSRYVLGGSGACAASTAPAESFKGSSKLGKHFSCDDAGKSLPTALVGVQTRKMPVPHSSRQRGNQPKATGTLQMRATLFSTVPLSSNGRLDEAIRTWVMDTQPPSWEMAALPNAQWRKIRGSPPPLRGEAAPGIAAVLTVWFWSWGWLLVTLIVGGAIAMIFFGDEIKKYVERARKENDAQQKAQQQRQAQQQQQQRQREAQAQRQQQQQRRPDSRAQDYDEDEDEDDDEEESEEEEPSPRTPHSSSSGGGGGGGGGYRPTESPRNGTSSNHSGGGGGTPRTPNGSGSASGSTPSSDGLSMCTADTIDQLVDSGSYVLICVTNAGVVDRGTMYGLARHLTELFSSAGSTGSGRVRSSIIMRRVKGRRPRSGYPRYCPTRGRIPSACCERGRGSRR